jgi:hypothetical protein
VPNLKISVAYFELCPVPGGIYLWPRYRRPSVRGLSGWQTALQNAVAMFCVVTIIAAVLAVMATYYLIQWRTEA